MAGCPLRALASTAACLVMLAGCAGSSAPAKPTGAEVNTGLSALAAGSSDTPDQSLTDTQKADLYQQAAADLQKALNQPPTPNSPGSIADQPPLLDSASLANLVPDPKPEPKADTSPPVVAPTPAAIAAADAAWSEAAAKLTRASAAQPVDPLQDLATRMAALLRETDGAGKPLVSDAVALAAIENLAPGSVASLEGPGSSLGAKLSGADVRTLLEARARLLSNPGGIDSQLAEALKGLGAKPQIRVSKAALCTRVQGFGRYDPFASDTFLAGRALRAIVYTELDGFTARPAREDDPVLKGVGVASQVSVELAQSLSLYHDSSGLLAWHRPAQRVVETSLQKRRDFYLIQQVELPPTLSVGKYVLKVTVEDKAAGTSAEAAIPINIVADPGLTGGR